MNIQIKHAICISCGACEEVCPLVNNFGFPSIDEAPEEFCLHCGHCAAACPVNAVTYFQDGTREWSSEIPSPAEIVQLIKQNRALRNFSSKSIPEKVWEDFSDVCRYSPTSMNFQEVRAIFIQDSESITQISEACLSTLTFFRRIYRFPLSRLFIKLRLSPLALQYLKTNASRYPLTHYRADPVIFNAPALILFAAPARLMSAETDSTIMATNISMAASAHGLGCCFIGAIPHGFFFNNRMLSKLIPLPQGYTVYQALALGYPTIRAYRIPPRKKVDSILELSNAQIEKRQL